MNDDVVTCPICNSDDLEKINTYKHYCYVCNDCNNIFHIKKEKYLLEYILPKSLCKKFIPEKAFLRLFSDDGSTASEFYDVYATECLHISEWRKSEIRQIVDQLKLAQIDLQGKTVLDISGGPGYVGQQLKKDCARIVVTEFSEKAVDVMRNQLNIATAKFDYTKDRLEDIFDEKFDLIMLRSSIIFCPNLDSLIASLRNILSPGGHILIETITPSLGEVFWWQQLEYKFPIIYSQETIEKYFYKHGFSLSAGFRDSGSYVGVKKRSYSNFSKHFFTWVIEYPMVLGYYLLSKLSCVAVDQRLHHKMLTQIWRKTEAFENTQDRPYVNYQQGSKNKSKTFGYIYNGYLGK